MERTRQSFFGRLRNLFSRKSELGSDFFEALEEALLSSDMGVDLSYCLLEELKASSPDAAELSLESLRSRLEQRVRQILAEKHSPDIIPERRGGQPLVVLVVGVNGVGKTTTIGKLAARFAAQGKKVLLGACDTFRAAAGEQIQIWAQRGNVDLIGGTENEKPTTVAYRAVHRAQEEGYDVLLIDTAGRLHNRANLMNELGAIIRMIDREQPGAPHESILVVDATTGQNALTQAREFNEVAKLTGVIVTKLDGSARGGIVVAIKSQLGIPLRYIGIGEKLEDLRPFSAEEFSAALFAADPTA